jgi:hypothetical protein
MKANELMIGDWVIDGKNIAQITSITCDGIIETTFNKSSNIEVIESIPLTPDILEKNGFTKSTPPPGIHARCYELDNKKDKYNLTIADYNKYKRLLLDIDSEDSECFNIKCDCVHELQHALRLCKVKKEIIL